MIIVQTILDEVDCGRLLLHIRYQRMRTLHPAVIFVARHSHTGLYADESGPGINEVKWMQSCLTQLYQFQG